MAIAEARTNLITFTPQSNYTTFLVMMGDYLTPTIQL